MREKCTVSFPMMEIVQTTQVWSYWFINMSNLTLKLVSCKLAFSAPKSAGFADHYGNIYALSITWQGGGDV